MPACTGRSPCPGPPLPAGDVLAGNLNLKRSKAPCEAVGSARRRAGRAARWQGGRTLPVPAASSQHPRRRARAGRGASPLLELQRSCQPERRSGPARHGQAPPGAGKLGPRGPGFALRSTVNGTGHWQPDPRPPPPPPPPPAARPQPATVTVPGPAAAFKLASMLHWHHAEFLAGDSSCMRLKSRAQSQGRRPATCGASARRCHRQRHTRT